MSVSRGNLKREGTEDLGICKENVTENSVHVKKEGHHGDDHNNTEANDGIGAASEKRTQKGEEERTDTTASKTKRRPSSANWGLSLEQKKENHILSENRRRALIRSSFDRLVELVPQLETSENRSEYAVLTKTSRYIEHLRAENERLQRIKEERGL